MTGMETCGSGRKSAADRKEGWIPDDLPEERDGRVISRQAFSAIELTCVAGETVEGGVARHGWVWCQADERTVRVGSSAATSKAVSG